MKDEGIERIEDALRRLGHEHEPPPGWEARVRAAIRERPRRWLGWTVPAFALAAGLVLAAPPAPARTFELDVRRERRGPPTRDGGADRATLRGPAMRSAGASVGDVIHVRVTGGAAFRAVWVYRDETRLVVACPGAAFCDSDGDGDALTAEVELTAPGPYIVVALSSTEPLPTPRGSYDADLAAVGDATQRIYEVDVR